jgi:hypothetical protein
MANFKLTDLLVANNPQGGDALYIVQNNISKQLSLQSLAANLPPVTIGGNLNVTNGTILSGDQIIEDTLQTTFSRRDRINIFEFETLDGENFPDLTGLPLSSFSNTTVFLSGANLNDGTGDDDTCFIKIRDYDADLVPEGFSLKIVQTGTMKYRLSGSGGIQVNNMRDSATYPAANIPSLSTVGAYSTLELIKLPNTLGQGRFFAKTSSNTMSGNSPSDYSIYDWD